MYNQKFSNTNWKCNGINEKVVRVADLSVEFNQFKSDENSMLSFGLKQDVQVADLFSIGEVVLLYTIL